MREICPYRIFVNNKMVYTQAVFWDKTFDHITEIRYLDGNNDIVAIKGTELAKLEIMVSTGIRETIGTRRFVFEGDVVEIEYQQGVSLCVVEWCKIKSSLVLRSIDGRQPKNQRHFRLSGKKRIVIRANVHEHGDRISDMVCGKLVS